MVKPPGPMLIEDRRLGFHHAAFQSDPARLAATRAAIPAFQRDHICESDSDRSAKPMNGKLTAFDHPLNLTRADAPAARQVRNAQKQLCFGSRSG